jgi:lysozyme
MAFGVLCVFCWRAPAQIFCTVVKRIAVIVQPAHAGGTLSGKRFQDKLVDRPVVGFSLFAECYHGPPVVAPNGSHITGKNSIISGRPRPFARRSRFYSAHAGNHVIGKVIYWQPLFHTFDPNHWLTQYSMIPEFLKQSIMQHEGLRLRPYMCTAQKLTIGYGRNLTDNGISESEAGSMLEADIAGCVAEADRAFPGWRDHNPARQNVIIELIFNMGAPRLTQFKRMWEALARRDYIKAAAEMLNSRWAQQVGKRAKTMAKQMETGIFP